MACENANEYMFHEVRKGVFERNCYALEEYVAMMEEYCDGFGHLTMSTSVSLPSAPSREVLEEKVKAAWTAFRHFTPNIACKVFRHSEGDKRFAFRYIVPQTKEDVAAWVNETVFFNAESPDKKALYDKHCELKHGRWWRSSEDHYAVELHVSPLGSDWHVSLIFSHNSIDGRNSFAMTELFLEFLKREMEGGARPNETSDWGSEVIRLQNPASFIASIAESGQPPDITLPSSKPKEGEDAAASPIVPWTFAPRPNGETGDVSRLVRLTEEATTKLRDLCRKKGKTITQVVTALTALAHTETRLNRAGKQGPERFNEVLGTYKAATHYLTPMNAINHRGKLPGGYDSYQSPKGAPLCSAESVPLTFPIRGIKSCIEIDEEKLTASRIVNEQEFWDVLVPDVASAWKAVDQSLESYATREVATHYAIESFSPQIFDLPLILISSIGDMGRLNILASLPSSQAKTKISPDEKLVLNDIICGVRVRIPPTINLFWEYQGRMTYHFMTGGDYTTTEQLESLARNFEEWTKAIVV